MADTYGTVALDEDLDGSPVTYHFCYQATAEFTITVNWSFSSSPTNPAVSVTHQELGGSPSTSSVSSPGQTGDEDFTLPASTFCYVKVEISGTGGTLTTSIS